MRDATSKACGPTHNFRGIEENEKADLAAKEAAGGERVGQQNGLARRRIMEEKKAQLLTWHGQMTKEREGGKSGFYFPCLKTQIDPLLGKTKKFYASRFYQLEIGHGAIGVAETAKCWWCWDAEQSIMHLYTKYRTPNLKKSLCKAGIQRQRRPEKRFLAGLLANKHAAGSLQEFLKNIEVGSREGAAEKAVEWRQRRDQDGEDRLGGL